MVTALPRLVLFTRYPDPGRAKTRLIPAIGAAAAASLHRRLTERAVATLRAAGRSIELRTTGADPCRFSAWLGDGLAPTDQGEGDLGQRLDRAAALPPVILLGADVPDLQVRHLEAAASALETYPAVIGPAEDGGYYLLGLARPMPFLFDAMPWGTERVLAETMARLDRHGASYATLETLADLDRPEDLARWPDLAE
ncbi:glycosyltransferase [Lichenicola cladoniae]|uniref:Glycosyltransferase n=1 Tax=Lichenicola cladoniae TaxID=1484109 RepID=A0A6M8HQU1_9PROT|nr:TIGR04282 family arsenosugar biosynthesis glycosyltransferase [Lichenicola cladoniae]NPD68747.1 glycosyltransferase [Acetobacteraceae bacterium]QKE90824.1 glycosyltransferase [Lichenicola cladoniae]